MLASDPSCTPQAARAALRFLLDSGVDGFVSDTPRNWLAAPAAAPLHPPVAAPVAKPVARKPDSRVPLQAKAISLDALAEEIAAHPHPLNPGDARPSLLHGPEEAPLLLLTDTRLHEDSDAGRLVMAMMAAIGLSDRVARLPVLPWPTSGGRPARPEELADFAPFARAGLRLARPRLALAFGPHVAAPLLGAAARPGEWQMLEGTPLLTTLSPALLLRTPALKAEVWAHLQSLTERLA